MSKGNDNMNNPNFLVYPGIKVGDNQNYTITWDYRTVFITHREDQDVVLFNSNDLGEYEKLEAEILFREWMEDSLDNLPITP